MEKFTSELGISKRFLSDVVQVGLDLRDYMKSLLRNPFLRKYFIVTVNGRDLDRVLTSTSIGKNGRQDKKEKKAELKISECFLCVRNCSKHLKCINL